MIAGLIGITGSCDNVEPGIALIIGIISGILFEALCKILIVKEIDDPL
jgi:ammonia channel protein AmtB